jgi:hypothetical protein
MGNGGIAPTHWQPRRSNRVMWSAVRSGRFISGKDPVPIVQERGWASGLLLDGTKNLAAPGFDPWIVQPIAICYTVYAIPTVVYNLGTEVNVVFQTAIRTLLPKWINNNAGHYARTRVVLFLSGMTAYSMGLSFFRDTTLRNWVIVSRHFETTCVLSLVGRNDHQHGTWTFRPLNIGTLRCLRNVGTRLRSDGIAVIAQRNAQNT